MNKVFKYGAVAATIGAPAAYMIHFHDKFYSDMEDRKKMLNKQLGFWGGMSAGVLLVHRNFKKHWKNKPILAATLAFMAAAPYAGVKLAKLINKKMFPAKEKMNIQQNQQEITFTRSLNAEFDSFIKSAKSY
ncbi:MAG: hypothetical protein AB1782_12630 [Cyanobacteriota bacterium]